MRLAPLRDLGLLASRLAAGLGLVVGLATLGAAGGACAASPPVQTGHVRATLAPETTAATPGRTVWVALHQTITPGWHTYWRNPGDAGQATTITWTLPPGWTAGDIVWPAPERFLAGPIMNYVYTGEVYLPVPIQVPAGAAPGRPATLHAVANWLACKDVCIPETATLDLPLPVAAGPSTPDPGDGRAIAATRAAAPQPAGLNARFQPAGATVRLAVSGPALKGLDPRDAYFFPFDGAALEQASPQTVVEDARGGVTLTLPAGYGFSHGKPPSRLEGVLSLGGKAFQIEAEPGPAPAGAASPAVAAGGASPGAGAGPHEDAAAPAAARKADGVGGLMGALALAFVGGLILNLMPCVFPVLSMKAAALARHVERPAHARADGLAFLAGVVASLLLLSAILLALRGAGQALGWGFQLQSPAVVAILALVMLATGLNLSGVFEVGLSLQGAGAGAASRLGGLAGSAFTGVLAVVVAAPCTAPFMAPAIGWALVQPPAAALGVFLALGLGLGAPFAAVAFVPALYRRLPRPGAWMEGLRHVLAFPMYGAAAWLAWVFTAQAGVGALPWLFAAALGAAFAAYAWGASQRTERPLPLRLVAGAALAIGLASVLPAAAPAAGPVEPVAGSAEAWSPERVAALRAQGRPVFVDFTAAWCVTCQVNERTTLATPAVRHAFARAHAVYLKADWTRPDARIAKALADQGRSGVPLYLVYGASQGGAHVLPQILTPGDVVGALETAARS